MTKVAAVRGKWVCGSATRFCGKGRSVDDRADQYLRHSILSRVEEPAWCFWKAARERNLKNGRYPKPCMESPTRCGGFAQKPLMGLADQGREHPPAHPC